MALGGIYGGALTNVFRSNDLYRGLANENGLWDSPTMTIKADKKRRVLVPDAEPGDVFAYENLGGGRFALSRLTVPRPPRKKTKREVRAAIKASKFRIMPWDELRKITREP